MRRSCWGGRRGYQRLPARTGVLHAQQATPKPEPYAPKQSDPAVGALDRRAGIRVDLRRENARRLGGQPTGTGASMAARLWARSRRRP